MDDHGEALKACYERAGCAGVSTDWYLGAPWYPVLGVKSFTPDSASYGCTLLLDRSEEE